MARFRYDLQALLDALAGHERTAEIALARALTARESARALLRFLENGIGELRRARPTTAQAWFPAEVERAIAALERRRVSQRAALVVLESRVERAQGELCQAAQRRATFERHRDRALASFAAAQARSEDEELEEANARRGAPAAPMRISDDVIVLHRPSGYPIVVNADLIETVEPAEEGGGSVVTLTSGNTILATEGHEAVREAVIDYRRRISSPLG
ncbi:MAG: flagellar FlbD family protein [Vulcanimicrobiaceae bacterium]